MPSFHWIRISPRCKVGEECGRVMACSVSGALSLGTGDPGTIISGLGVYDFKTHTTFLLLAQREERKWLEIQSLYNQSALKDWPTLFAFSDILLCLWSTMFCFWPQIKTFLKCSNVHCQKRPNWSLKKAENLQTTTEKSKQILSQLKFYWIQ